MKASVFLFGTLSILSLATAQTQTSGTPAKPDPKAVEVSIEKLLADREKLHEKMVKVSGKVDKYEQRTSRAGNPYVVFDIVDGKFRVHIYGQGKLAPAVKNGDSVLLMGKFRKEKQVGSQTFKDEIQIDLKKKPIEVK
jgi:hypothetical protein